MGRKPKEETKGRTKIEQLTEIEKFCLIAFLNGGDLDMAYKISRPRQSKSEKPDIIHRMALKWLKVPAVKMFTETYRKVNDINAPQLNDDDLDNFRSKDYLIDQYAKLIQVTTDPKLKSELLWRVSELQTMRRQETEENKDTRYYYLPLSCNQCNLYRKGLDQKQSAIMNIDGEPSEINGNIKNGI